MGEIVTSVKAVLYTKDSFLLLDTGNGVRDLPGGRIEFGETTLETLSRELLEEIGLSVQNNPLLHWVWTYTSRSKNIHQVMVVYKIFLKEERHFIHLEESGTACRWVSKNDIVDLRFIPEMEKFLLAVFN